MEKLPKNVKENLSHIFADKDIPRITEKDTFTGEIIEVLNHGDEILTRIESPDWTNYQIDGEYIPIT